MDFEDFWKFLELASAMAAYIYENKEERNSIRQMYVKNGKPIMLIYPEYFDEIYEQFHMR